MVFSKYVFNMFTMIKILIVPESWLIIHQPVVLTTSHQSVMLTITNQQSVLLTIINQQSVLMTIINQESVLLSIINQQSVLLTSTNQESVILVITVTILNTQIEVMDVTSNWLLSQLNSMKMLMVDSEEIHTLDKYMETIKIHIFASSTITKNTKLERFQKEGKMLPGIKNLF